MTDASKTRSIEQRLLVVEDRLEILNLIAAHPLGADSASHDFAEAFWMAGGTVDMAGQAKGYESMIGVLNTPGFAEAQRQGICHFTGLPHITIDGDHAVATSYLQILAADPDGRWLASGAWDGRVSFLATEAFDAPREVLAARAFEAWGR